MLSCGAEVERWECGRPLRFSALPAGLRLWTAEVQISFHGFRVPETSLCSISTNTLLRGGSGRRGEMCGGSREVQWLQESGGRRGGDVKNLELHAPVGLHSTHPSNPSSKP